MTRARTRVLRGQGDAACYVGAEHKGQAVIEEVFRYLDVRRKPSRAKAASLLMWLEMKPPSPELNDEWVAQIKKEAGLG